MLPAETRTTAELGLAVTFLVPAPAPRRDIPGDAAPPSTPRTPPLPPQDPSLLLPPALTAGAGMFLVLAPQSLDALYKLIGLVAVAAGLVISVSRFIWDWQDRREARRSRHGR